MGYFLRARMWSLWWISCLISKRRRRRRQTKGSSRCLKFFSTFGWRRGYGTLTFRRRKRLIVIIYGQSWHHLQSSSHSPKHLIKLTNCEFCLLTIIARANQALENKPSSLRSVKPVIWLLHCGLYFMLICTTSLSVWECSLTKTNSSNGPFYACSDSVRARDTCSLSCADIVPHEPASALLNPMWGCEGIYYFFNPEGRRKVSSIIIFLQNVTDFTAHPNLLAVIIGHAPLL